MGQRIKFYVGYDEISVQEHIKNEKSKSCLSDLIDSFYYVFNCF